MIYSFCLKKIKIRKLVVNLHNRKINIRKLKQALNHELVLKKGAVKRVIKFIQEKNTKNFSKNTFSS